MSNLETACNDFAEVQSRLFKNMGLESRYEDAKSL